jgi:hypothetical protein
MFRISHGCQYRQGRRYIAVTTTSTFRSHSIDSDRAITDYRQTTKMSETENQARERRFRGS